MRMRQSSPPPSAQASKAAFHLLDSGNAPGSIDWEELRLNMPANPWNPVFARNTEQKV